MVQALDRTTGAIEAASPRFGWNTLVQLIVWLITLMLAYGNINTRLQVLEVKYDRMTQDVQEIKGDVKELLRTR